MSPRVFAEADHNLDPDHKLIIKSSTPLLKSRNTGVVVAVCSLHFYCGSRNAQSNIQIGKVGFAQQNIYFNK